MSMEINSTPAYQTAVQSTVTEKNTSKKVEDKQSETSQTQEKKTTDDTGVVYEKSEPVKKETQYKINKMSQSDRDALVSQLKAEAQQRQEQLMSLVQKTLNGQVGAFGKATDNDIWRTLAGGNVKVDAQTRAQAQKDIGEDGYWGVKQTSQRLFDFASALAGDDVEKMKKMQSAMEKGFKLATGAWGRELPSICKDTFDAANKLFDDYYKAKENASETSGGESIWR